MDGADVVLLLLLTVLGLGALVASMLVERYL
jgi:hypothetical protein